MPRSFARLFCAGAVAASLIALPACYVDDMTPWEVSVQPPPPRFEVIPAPPYAGAIWAGGYWGWRHNRHVWVPGRYVHPRPGWAYSPHSWQRMPNGRWRHQGGWYPR
jgi:hypothetical protein